MINLNCKKCVFYTGTSCHGHGEYFGRCNAICELKHKDFYSSIVYDDTICKILKNLEYFRDNLSPGIISYLNYKNDELERKKNIN